MIFINNQLSDSKKKRNFFLAFLISLFMIVDIIALKVFASSHLIFDFRHNNELAFLILTILDLIFCIYLFMWKKWAFWGMLTTSLITFILNLYTGIDIIQSLLGVVGIVLLFGALQLKKSNVSGWKNLE